MEMPKRILIVEDHPIYAEALELTIRSGMSDVRITQAGTLCEAKNAIREGKDFDLVLLDLWLPDTHGFEGLIELAISSPGSPSWSSQRLPIRAWSIRLSCAAPLALFLNPLGSTPFCTR